MSDTHSEHSPETHRPTSEKNGDDLCYLDTARDASWLESSGIPPATFEDVLREMNTNYFTGSIRLDSEGDMTNEAEVLAAREAFMMQVLSGMDDADRTRIMAYLQKVSRTLSPCESVLSALRWMGSSGINVQKVLKRAPSVLYVSDEGLSAKRSLYQTEMGLDFPRLIDDHPGLLLAHADTVRHRFAGLQAHGLDANAIVSTKPIILAFAKTSVDEKIASIKRTGLDPIRLASAEPNVLISNPTTLWLKIACLEKMGYISFDEDTMQIIDFPYDKTAFIKKLNVLPLATLILYADAYMAGRLDTSTPNNVSTIPDRAVDYAKRNGFGNASARESAAETFIEQLKVTSDPKRLGSLAVLYANHISK